MPAGRPSSFHSGAACLAATLALAAPARAAAPVAAAPPVPARGSALHLDDALAIARQRNFDVRSAVDEAAIADAGIHTARQHPNPDMTFTSQKIHTNGGDATEAGNDLWSRSYDNLLQFGQTVELDGKRGDRRRVAAATATEAHARLADARRTLEADVVQAYAAAALADADQRIARESAGFLRNEAQIAEVRWKAGDISRSDLDQIEIAAARLDLDAQSAASVARTQRIALETLLGVPAPDGAIVVADSLEALVGRVGAVVPEVPGGVRPDVAAADAEVGRAEAAWKLEKANRIPDPTLLFLLEHEPPVRPNSVGLGVALPLPLWNRNGGNIAAARAARDQAQNEAARAAATVSADVAAARAAFDEASVRWQRYRDDLRPRSDAIRRSVSLAYEKGGASLLDLLEAQRSDNDVRLATMQAANDAVIADARLRAATTTILPEVRRP